MLRDKYPELIVVHNTFPLTVSKTSFKTWIKKLIGKEDIWEYAHNVKTNQFDEFLRKEYLGKEPLFDIAELQSTVPDGRRSTFTFGGGTFF